MSVVLTETIDGLRRRAEQAPDAAGLFPAMYAQVTAVVQQRCLAGGFEDPARMVRFATTFAGYYERAADDRSRAARCWQASWNVAGDPDLLIVQHLLLGINAHVNHDLPQAVVALAETTGDLASIRPDFDAMNDVLADTFSDITRRLDGAARWTSTVAALGGGRLFNFSLRVARRQAWSAAERMSALDAAGRAVYVRQLDDMVCVLAYLATQPRPPASLLVPILRRLETRDPRQATQRLLADLE